MTKCTSIWGHRFVARYTTEQQRVTTEMLEIAAGVGMALKLAPTQIYICDVCVRCGAHPPVATTQDPVHDVFEQLSRNPKHTVKLP